MITIDRTPAGLLLTPSGAAPVLIADAAIPSALGPAIVALTLGTHAAQRARTEGYAAPDPTPDRPRATPPRRSRGTR